MSSQRFVQRYSLEEERIRSQKESKACSSKVVDPRCGEYSQSQYYERFLDLLGDDDVSFMANASVNFDKQALVTMHVKARLYLHHPQAGRNKKTLEHETEGTYETTEAANDLVPVSITDLKLMERNEGVVFFGELCVEPLKIGRNIYTLLEEEGTEKAVALCVTSPYQSFAIELSRGTKIALKEPELIEGESNLLFVHVKNPLCIEMVESFPATNDVNITVGSEKFKTWMAFGYMAYHAGQWENCMRNYSKCVACLYKGMKEDASAINVMYIQRCVAYVELHRYKEAAQDADKVEPLDNIGVEYKIRSLLSVGRYKDAFSFLQRCCDRFPEKKQIFTAAYRKWSALCFDISEAIIDPAAGTSSIVKPDGDFVGPVEIRMTSNGCGRGLFATEKIEEGEVLLISKALAVSETCREPNELYQNVKEKLKFCGEKTCQMFFSHYFKDLFCLVPFMPDFIVESTGEYILSTESNKDDTTADARYENADYNDKELIIPPILKRIALDDSSPFSMKQICKQPIIFNPVLTRLYYGVWLLASFINHSCAPNAATINVGDIMRIHAATEISAGEEISIPYFNVLFPYPCRQEACKSFGFSCLCVRCELETKVMEHESRSKKLYRDYLRLSICEPQKLDARLESIALQVETCLNVLKRMVNNDQDIDFYQGWIRASFTPVYVALLESRSKKLGESSTVGGVKIEEEILYNGATGILATCPGSLQCLVCFHRCLCFWKERAGRSPSFEILYEGRLDEARQCLKEAFPSVYGHQEDHVVQAVLKNLD